jgi:hypothetical protein
MTRWRTIVSAGKLDMFELIIISDAPMVAGISATCQITAYSGVGPVSGEIHLSQPVVNVDYFFFFDRKS